MINRLRTNIAARRLRGIPAMARPRKGFSLVEVIVAIALFGVSMSAIGAFMLTVAHQSTRNWANNQRTAAELALVNDLAVVPFASLNARVGCTTVTTNPFKHTACITVTDLSATRKRVRVTVTPTNTAIPASWVQFEQVKPPAGNPFHVQP